ncbi:CRISPR-associated endonuclease Cas2 [Porphyromonas macacae]|uniref:CRISPR-associated endoribonuclease Cas2 n=1 Tax=Porphyromonas macacae TaxID=28115 RepID=A0A379DIR9_9PORP|nr:CRISPR-associated endonuclease Cas2 [Porphyromonas macacae]SUB78268.1 CRISPR-associated endoribonuclease Cas2 [Porphyromonas macacae]
MYLLITYDVCTSSPSGAKRLRQVARICQNYGQRVQNSVFECLVDPTQFILMRQALLNTIDEELDSLRIYQLGKNYRNQILFYGRVTSFELEGELII